MSTYVAVPIVVFVALLTSVALAGGDESATSTSCGCEASLEKAFAAIEKVPLTKEETKRLLYLRQEEKLARDVYRTLGARWKLRIYDNIQHAEQRHIEHIQRLLTHYGIEDPIKDDATGVFADPALTKLYKALTTEGAKSELKAIEAGMKIEDMDIADLQALLAFPKANAHVRLIAHNLLKGSRNHLRAFARNLASRKGTYKAQHLTQEALDAIAASEHERGVAYDQDGKPLGKATCASGCCGGGSKGSAKGQGRGKGCGAGQGKGKGKGCGQGRGKGRGRGCGGGGCGGKQAPSEQKPAGEPKPPSDAPQDG